MKRHDTLSGSARRGFTLIELLMVIAIMGILAALVVGLAGAAGKKKKIARVQTELARLEHAIDWYKEKKGAYPPDNPNNPVLSSLFYELTGTTFNASQANPLFTNILGETLSGGTAGDVQKYFGNDGFANSSTDNNEVQRFYLHVTTVTHADIINHPPPPPPQPPFVRVLVVPVDGPPLGNPLPGNFPSTPALSPDLSTGRLNPWRYVSSNPTNNPNSYDLWADIVISGKTNRICNWSKSPVAL